MRATANSKQQQLQFNTQQQQPPPPPSFHNTHSTISHALLLAFNTLVISSIQRKREQKKKETSQLKVSRILIKMVRAHSRKIPEVAIIHQRSQHSHYHYPIMSSTALPPPSYLTFRRDMHSHRFVVAYQFYMRKKKHSAFAV